MAFNKIILQGNLTADPEVKQTPSGVSVTNFTLAVDRKYNKGEEKQADFITIIAWRHTADFITKYFTKGSASCRLGLGLTSRGTNATQPRWWHPWLRSARRSTVPRPIPCPLPRSAHRHGISRPSGRNITRTSRCRSKEG